NYSDIKIDQGKPSTCGACGWAIQKNKSRTRVWCWLNAMQKFAGSIACPDAMRDVSDALAEWWAEREMEIYQQRGG
ncbi:hypothetical protein M1O47_03495, partial [Dehalococcoidia bacterium]|nr:hypothetical protein [Dehalococcoidia bacterium]